MTTADLLSRQVLEAVEEARSQVALLQESVRSLEVRSANLTTRYEPRYGSSGSAGPENQWVQLADRRVELNKRKQQLQVFLQTVEQWINLLPKPRWRMVLRYRYLEGLDLQDTCRVMSRAAGHAFSMTQIYRLHRQALLSADALWPLRRTGGTGNAGDVLIESGLFPNMQAATEQKTGAEGAGPEWRS